MTTTTARSVSRPAQRREMEQAAQEQAAEARAVSARQLRQMTISPLDKLGQ